MHLQHFVFPEIWLACRHFLFCPMNLVQTLRDVDVSAASHPVPPHPWPRKGMSEIALNPNGCNFLQLLYFKLQLSCRPDAMHAMCGYIKDMLRSVQGSQRMTPALMAYMLKVNKDDFKDNKPWEASEYKEHGHKHTQTH